MKPLTAKKRREIYLKVAERVFALQSKYDGLTSKHFLCNQLKECGRLGFWTSSKYVFAEFALFMPDGDVWTWWEENDFESRIICMLLCAEMTKK